jgi:N-acetylglucosamine malate deacetylase 1
MSNRKIAFAMAAHPDDIEFMMAGTLFLLKEHGWEIHYMNIGNGSCGTATLTRAEIIRIRGNEAKAAAKYLGAVHHASLVNDIDIFYEKTLLAQVGAVMREVNPRILLLPSPDDYMEDHSITSRLGVTAAFCKGMRNYPTLPRKKAVTGDTTVYHALPYGLHDGMRRRITPELYVNIGAVLAKKREMLAKHRSQKEWLDVSQGLDSYLATMESMSAEVGKMSGKFKYAEGWRRHSHLGFAAEDEDVLAEELGELVGRGKKYLV